MIKFKKIILYSKVFINVNKKLETFSECFCSERIDCVVPDGTTDFHSPNVTYLIDFKIFFTLY